MQQPWFSTTVLLVGRFLLGLYFILPGISKITGFEATSAYMAAHGMQMIPVFLILTIVLQIGGGIALIVGAWTRIVAFCPGRTRTGHFYCHARFLEFCRRHGTRPRNAELRQKPRDHGWHIGTKRTRRGDPSVGMLAVLNATPQVRLAFAP